MKRAVIYTRVSTADQADSGTSLDTQEEACQSWAAEHGYKVVDFVREDYSGGTPFRDRPAGANAWATYTGDSSVKAIICYDYDRYSRTDNDLGLLSDALEHGDGFKFVHGAVGGRYEKLLRGMRILMGQQEREDIKHRTSLGRHERWAQGKRGGGFAPYGLTFDRESGRWGVNDAEVKVVKLIFRKYVAGMGMANLAGYLNDEGVPSPGNGRRKGKAKWSSVMVRRIIIAPYYVGVMPAQGYNVVIVSPKAKKRCAAILEAADLEMDGAEVVVVDDFPVVLPLKLWKQANDVRRKRLAIRGPMVRKERPVETRLLAGRVQCGSCGRNFYPGYRRQQDYHVFYCSGRHKVVENSGEKVCKATPILKASHLTADVMGHLSDLLANPHSLAIAVKDRIGGLETRIEELGVQMRPVLEERKQLDARRNRLVRLYKDGMIGDGEYEADRSDIEAQMARMDSRTGRGVEDLKELEQLQAQRDEYEAIIQVLEGWDTATEVHEWRHLFGQLWELKPPRLWDRLVELTDPTIVVQVDGTVLVEASLPSHKFPLRELGAEPFVVVGADGRKSNGGAVNSGGLAVLRPSR